MFPILTLLNKDIIVAQSMPSSMSIAIISQAKIIDYSVCYDSCDAS